MRWSSQIHAGFHGPGATWDDTQRLRVFNVRGYYPLWPDFPDGSDTQQLGNSVRDLVLSLVIPQPHVSNATRLDTDTVWSLPSSLAATEGVAVAFLSSGY